MKLVSAGSTLIAIVGLVMAAGLAQAGHLNRPDLLDVEHYFSDTKQPSSVIGRANVFIADSFATWSIYATAYNGITAAFFGGAIEDFDKAAKTTKRASATNKKYTYMVAFTSTTGGTTSSVYNTSSVSTGASNAKCKSSVQAKDTTGDGNPDVASWKMGCNKGILDDLGMSAAAQTRFIDTFKGLKAKGIKAKTLSYKGKGACVGGEGGC